MAIAATATKNEKLEWMLAPFYWTLRIGIIGLLSLYYSFSADLTDVAILPCSLVHIALMTASAAWGVFRLRKAAYG